MSKGQSKKLTRRRVRRQENALRNDAPYRDVTIGYACRRRWGAGASKT
ncbi:hypothetical protein LCGC14_1627200 [marine sediment metagenome]|uniref:Uncharacterized protein n=1 Tax=marine sediment metagenome TaxID=412755 RepID=A0A0F9I414_9ZZZZ